MLISPPTTRGARLRAVVEAKDAEVVMLRAAAERELRRRMELRIAELRRRLGQDSSNAGTPTSKESIGAKERRKAERTRRDWSERERRQDRRRGGQPGHPEAGLTRDPDPEERKTAEPSARCSRCGTGLAGAQPAGVSWTQVWDVSISRLVTEWLLPALICPYCGQVSTRGRPARRVPGQHLLRAGPQYRRGAGGRVRERARQADRAPDQHAWHAGVRRVLGTGPPAGSKAGFARPASRGRVDDAMQAALAAESALGADETPVSVLTPEEDPDTGEPDDGSPHVLITRPPAGS